MPRVGNGPDGASAGGGSGIDSSDAENPLCAGKPCGEGTLGESD